MLSAPAQVWVDGALVPSDAPRLLVTDRGFQLGDGLFESLRARRGVLIEWEEHLRRLHEGAEKLSIPLPDDLLLAAGCLELLDAEQLSGPGDERSMAGDAAIRITVSRGPVVARGTLPAGWQRSEPTVVIQVWPYAPPPTDVLEQGLRAITTSVRRDPGSPLAGVKATSRADHVFARLEAERAGVDEALFLVLDGRLSESTSANVWALVGDELATPGRDSAILAGTTRTWLLTDPAPQALGLVPVERDLYPMELLAADEAFVSSSVAGIIPLVELDGQPIGAGRPGERTSALRAAREAWIDQASLEGRAAIGR
jgi:branched-chain amino acid aminotransferase